MNIQGHTLPVGSSRVFLSQSQKIPSKYPEKLIFEGVKRKKAKFVDCYKT